MLRAYMPGEGDIDVQAWTDAVKATIVDFAIHIAATPPTINSPLFTVSPYLISGLQPFNSMCCVLYLGF